MRTVREIVLELGGTSRVAKLHHPPIAVSNVDTWMRNNSVPRWRKPELCRIAKEQGKPLKETDIPSREQHQKLVG